MSDLTQSPAAVAKKEVSSDQERTRAGKTFTPATDIFETAKALIVMMDVPGVKRDDVQIRLENNVLEVEGRIEAPTGNHRQAVYSEYNVGNFYRRFNVSNLVARDGIEAKIQDGVLTLTVPKAPEATARRIPVH